MNFKVDTKEKFTTIMLNEQNMYANVAESLSTVCIPYLSKPVKNIILQLSNVEEIDEQAACRLAELQQSFYAANASFVICCLKKEVENTLDKFELLEVMNVTPTESEAWDIVQMEEIERELLDSDDVAFDV
ncbi:MAG: STAS domain-containing protein [Chitinophagaceae bacterium]|nr:STAS domain-containing protein [Chitinophagaceae bacterium]MCW5905617.1 STAS domain-containing protein [Chitinophagaceae bacterium]